MGRLFHNSVGKLISQSKEIFFAKQLKTIKDGKYKILPEVVYVSQFALANFSKINEFYQPINDKAAAKRFGTKNLKDFNYWAWRSCGIAGIQMVLKTTLGKDFTQTTMDLINQLLEQNGYEFKGDAGWKHQSLAKIAKVYGIQSKVEKFVPTSQIAKYILENKYVLASIKSKHGGHLLLIYGVQLKNGTIQSFITHDPSDFKKKGASKEIPRDEFEKLSTRRIIVFNPEKL